MPCRCPIFRATSIINTTDVLRQTNDNTSARVDYPLSEKLRLFGRYSGAVEDASVPATVPNRAGLDNAIPAQCGGGFFAVISPNKVNDLRLGFNRLNFLFGLPEPHFSVAAADTMLPNFIVGQLNFGGAGPYNATGPGGIARARDNIYQAWDIFAWQIGRHSLKLGGEFDAFQYVRFEYADPLGSLTFTQRLHRTPPPLRRKPPTNRRCPGFRAARIFRSCRANAGAQPHRRPPIELRRLRAGRFPRCPRVTINLGLRYEVLSAPVRHSQPDVSHRFQHRALAQAIFANGQQGIYSPTLFVCGKDGYPAGLRLHQLEELQPARRCCLVC